MSPMDVYDSLWAETRGGKLVWVRIIDGNDKMDLLVGKRDLADGALTLQDRHGRRLIIPKAAIRVQRYNLGYTGRAIDAAQVDITGGMPRHVSAIKMDAWKPEDMV